MTHLRRTCRDGNPCSVLLIDDEILILEMLRQAAKIQEAGCFNLVHALTLEDAALKLRALKYDLVILDLGLETSKGIATLLTLKGLLNDNAPVAILTGTDDAETEVRCYEEGAVGYVVKPITNVTHFLSRCRGWILKFRREREAYQHDMEVRTTLLKENETLRNVQELLRESQRLQQQDEDTALELAQNKVDARTVVPEKAVSAIQEVAETLFRTAKSIGERYLGQGTGH